MANINVIVSEDIKEAFMSFCKKNNVTCSSKIREWINGAICPDDIESNDNEYTRVDKEKYRMSFLMEKDLVDRFDNMCKLKMFNKSAILRNIVEDFCKENEK